MLGQSLENIYSVAGGREGIRAGEPADALMSVGETGVKRSGKSIEMEGTCANDEEIQGEGSLALEGSRIHLDLGAGMEDSRGEGGESLDEARDGINNKWQKLSINSIPSLPHFNGRR